MHFFSSKAFSSLRESEGSDNASVRFTRKQMNHFSSCRTILCASFEEFCFLKHENILTFSSSV